MPEGQWQGGAAKAFRDGTHRSCAPSLTIARLEPLLSTFGITRIANLTGLDRTGVPVVMVCRPDARSSAVFHGKGIDLAAAKASGLMEAIETWHAERVLLPLRLASAEELRAVAAVAEVEAMARVPWSRYRPDLAMLWVEGEDLVGRRRVWLPFEAVHADGTLREVPGSGCFAASTNGLASGNHWLEAVSHALCEVIERDARSLWHRLPAAEQDATRVDLASVTDETAAALLERLAARGLGTAVWDITSDIGVPAFQCLLLDSSGEIAHVGQGAGCHPVREIALARALTEAAQVRTTYIVGSREDIAHADYAPATLDRRTRSTRALMARAVPQRGFLSCPSFPFDTFEEEVAWIIGRLAAAGIGEAIAVDLTRREHAIPVVRIVVPGLEGSDHHPGYAPGRRALALGGRP